MLEILLQTDPQTIQYLIVGIPGQVAHIAKMYPFETGAVTLCGISTLGFMWKKLFWMGQATDCKECRERMGEETRR